MSNTMDIAAAMASITSRLKGLGVDDVEQILTKCLEKVRIPGPRGAQGDPGKCVCREPLDGKNGADGKDAPIPQFLVGSVKSADFATADLKRDSNGVYVLNLTLARGERGLPGEKSTVPGPRGFAGKDGVDAPQPTEAQIAAVAHKFIEDNVEKFRGQTGPAGESIKGPKGDPAMTRSEIAQIIIETMQSAGVMNSYARKIVEVRAKLKAAIHEADSRHISQISDLVRACDKVFDVDEPQPVVAVAPAAPTPRTDPEADALRRENALLRDAQNKQTPALSTVAVPTEEKKAEPQKSWFKSLVTF